MLVLLAAALLSQADAGAPATDAGAPPVAEAAAPAPKPSLVEQYGDLKKFVALPLGERKKIVQANQKEVGELIAATSPGVLLDIGKQVAEGMGVYKATLAKKERIKGKMSGLEICRVTVREKPQAINMEYTGGDAKGRKIAYDSKERKDQLKVREKGILGLTSIWLDLTSDMVRKESNHGVNDLGFVPLIGFLQKDFVASKGTHARKDEGFDKQGRYCSLYTAPKDMKLYATQARICIDPVLALPTLVDVTDSQGPLEFYEYSDVGPGDPKALTTDI